MLKLIIITPTYSGRTLYLWHRNGRRYSRHFYSMRSAYAWLVQRHGLVDCHRDLQCFRIVYFTRQELEHPDGCDPNTPHVVELSAKSYRHALQKIARLEDVAYTDIEVQKSEDV